MFKKLLFIVAASLIAVIFLRSFMQEKPQVKIEEAVFSVEVADSLEERIQGLAGRAGLKSGHGMLFIFEKSDLHSFWMKGMNFPLDLVWIQGDRVVGFSEDLPPDNSPNPKVYYPPALVDRVLEINAGEVANRGIKIGDKVELSL